MNEGILRDVVVSLLLVMKFGSVCLVLAVIGEVRNALGVSKYDPAAGIFEWAEKKLRPILRYGVFAGLAAFALLDLILICYR